MNKSQLLQDKVLKKYIDSLRAHFKNRLKNILLFGSRARGDHSTNSDYDCVLLLTSVYADDQNFIDKVESDILLDDFLLFSSFLVTLLEFETRKYEPFLMNAKKEGILL